MHFVNSPQLSFDAKIEGMYFLYSFLDTEESTHNGFHSDRISFIFSSTFVILFMYFTVIPLTGCLPGETKGVKPHEIRAGSMDCVMCFHHSSLSTSAHYPIHALKTNPPIINIKITKAINQNSFCRFFFESSLSFSNFLII